jgi:hypothetical protein
MSDWREVDIKVFLHPESEPKFHLECDELPGGPHPNHFDFTNNGHDGFLLNYILQEPRHGYFWPDDPDEALYSAKGSGCPKNKGHWGQFKAKEVKTPNNKVLVVRNMNRKGQEGEFGDTLRVTKTPHDETAEYLDLDPGGTNRNGRSSFQVNYLKIAGIGLTTGILGAIATTVALAKLNLICPSPPGF